MARAYDQHCGLAHALDLAGERWTLLIVRELMSGPRRYTDLAAGLVTVPTNLLAARLKQMEAGGLVRRRQLPAPATSVAVYELTEEGETLAPAVIALARWGMRTLPTTPEGRPFQARWLVLALQARFEAAEAGGVAESYEFRIDGDEVVHFAVRDGAGIAGVGPAAEPAVTIAADADTFLELTSGELAPEEALARGARIEGDPAAIERMTRILPSRAVPQGAFA